MEDVNSCLEVKLQDMENLQEVRANNSVEEFELPKDRPQKTRRTGGEGKPPKSLTGRKGRLKKIPESH